MAALSSEQKLPKFLDRCMNGTPRIQLDVHRINRLASLGPPRRVPCSEGYGNGAASHPSSDICTKEFSLVLDSAPAKSETLLTTKYAPVDSVEVRKRKADRDVPSGQEYVYSKHAEGRPNPTSRNQLDIFADLKTRKPIELAKDFLDIQDKENINPRSHNPRRDARKQTNELTDEKRRLQVSKKVQNGQGGRKVGSLLMKQPMGCFRPNVGSQPTALLFDRCGEKGNAQQSGLDYVMETLKADDQLNKMQPCALSPSAAVQHLDDNAISTSDSMSISQPLQFGSHIDNAQLVAYGQASSTLVERSCQNDAVSASVRELSCSMSTLVICGEIVHNPSVSEKAGLQADVADSKNSLVAIDPKSIAQVCAAAACPTLPPASAPYTSMSACSIAVRTASAPLATSFSLTQQSTGQKGQPSCSPGILQPLSKHSPGLGIEGLKSYQANLAPLPSSNGEVKQLHKEEGQLSSKGSLLENGALKTGLDKASLDEPISEAGAVKLLSHMHATSAQEKKPASSGDASVQLKKHGETEYIVWVNGKRYQKLKKIGRGGSSEVYKVVDRECNMYALKRIKLKGRDYATACGFYQEIEYLNKLRGKRYIIRLIDHEITEKDLFSCNYNPSHVIREDIYIYMVLEYGEIDLANMLEEKLKERAFGNDEVDETWLRFYWQQILEAVNTIHEERIVHSDLKPANFLLVKGVLKLIDFGIAKSIQSDTTNIERDAQVGTLNYMSPEAFLMNEKDEHGHVIKCGRPSDIWSLGCILYQMVYGKTPFAHITKLHAKIQEVANPNHKIAFPPLSNTYLTDIMKSCLAWKKEERLRIPQLLNHPFLQPHLAIPTYSTNPKEALLQLQKEHSQDEEVRMLTERLLERLTLCNNAMDSLNSSYTFLEPSLA